MSVVENIQKQYKIVSNHFFIAYLTHSVVMRWCCRTRVFRPSTRLCRHNPLSDRTPFRLIWIEHLGILIRA